MKQAKRVTSHLAGFGHRNRQATGTTAVLKFRELYFALLSLLVLGVALLTIQSISQEEWTNLKRRLESYPADER